MAPASDGRLLAVGVTGFHQNPNGASVDEATTALAAVLDPQGRLLNRINLPQLGRSNHARSIVAPGGDRFLVSGMLDGPGTHSADADQSLAASRGAMWILEPHARRAAGSCVPPHALPPGEPSRAWAPKTGSPISRFRDVS